MHSDGISKDKQTFWYVGWFCDTTQPPDEEDYEWCACFLIDTESATLAQLWGDELSRRFSKKWPTEKFLRSEAQQYQPDEVQVQTRPTPHIAYGYEATDEEIGW